MAAKGNTPLFFFKTIGYFSIVLSFVFYLRGQQGFSGGDKSGLGGGAPARPVAESQGPTNFQINVKNKCQKRSSACEIFLNWAEAFLSLKTRG